MFRRKKEKKNISFDARMKRVRKGAKGSMQRQISATAGAPVMLSMPTRMRRQFVLFKMILGFGVGLGALLAAKVIFFHFLSGGVPEDSVYLTGLFVIGDVGLGAALALLTMVLISLKPLMAQVAVAAGFGTMMYGETDLALRLPEVWGMLFSPAHAAQVAAGQQMLPQLLALAS